MTFRKFSLLVPLLLFAFPSAPNLSAAVKLVCPAGYLPGRPFPVRVEVLNQTGGRDWNQWSGEAILTVDQPGVALSTDRVALRNGLGTVLLTVSGNNNFSLRATFDEQSAVRAVRNRSGDPVTPVSGILPGASSAWSGVVNVTGNVTIPAGHTLTINPDTFIYVNGVASGTSGITISVNGNVQSLGTEQLPVTITCGDPLMNWGQIRHAGAVPSLYQHTLISKAGRVAGEGHTGTGPAIRMNNSSLTLESCVISDLNFGSTQIGKIMMATGSTLGFRNCVFARARMGPEIASTGLVCTNSYFMEMRGPDDADGIYLHDSGSRQLLLSGCVLAGGDDDAVDTLDSTVTIENCILRDWPNPNEDAKGVSAFNGEVILRRCLIANCFAGVATKSSGSLGVVRIDHCTISGIEKGVSAATKSNASAGNLNIYVTNSIILAPDALHSDFGDDRFVTVTYCALSESWPGIGNITADPLFWNAAAGDFRLQPGSPAIDAGDPAAPLDPDGSRTDIGFHVAESVPREFYVTITSPSVNALFTAPTNLLLNAVAATTSSTISRVDFYQGGSKLSEDFASPYSVAWNNVGIGNYTVQAFAFRNDGLIATSAPVNFSVASGEVPSTNTLVAAGSQWKYLDDGVDQGSAWAAPAFNDQAWSSGTGEFGYGDGDEVTPMNFGPNSNSKYPTYYFRKAFSFDEEPARIQQLNLNLLRDDGAVVYLNGQEVYRVSMPAGPITYATYATEAGEYSWQSAALEPALLRAGLNSLAVEVHQGNAGSSDMSFDLSLSAVLAAPTNARPLIAITAPSSNAIFGAPANITITASAADPDGTIANVAFTSNGTNHLGNTSTAPYTMAWNFVPAGNYALRAVATDNFGLVNTSGVVNVLVSADTTGPRVLAQSPAPGTATNLTHITVTFSKAVTGVDASDLLLNGLPAREFTGSGDTYTFAIATAAPGAAVVSWASSHGIRDTFTPANPFEANAAGSSWQYQLLDTQAPIIAASSPVPGSSVGNLSSIVLNFSETVTGLNASDLLINGVAATGLSGSGAGPYTFSFAQPAIGNVQVSWAAAHGIRDLGNNPFAGQGWSYALESPQNSIVISEIMYHPASENQLEEYIELFNRGSVAVNLNGWRFSDGVDFTFPNVSIPAGGYLVVVANRAAFQSKYPGIANILGDWAGSLSNSREDIDLDDPSGNRVDSLRYADEGDWATRQRGVPDRGQRGWRWFSEHDGLGKSAELINPAVSNNNGQNWASSLLAEGTPGRANSVLTNRTAPVIENVAHFPTVPKSTNPVVVTATITGSSSPNPAVTLNYRAGPLMTNFASVLMQDNGQSGDAFAGDAVFSATLPAQSNNIVVEFFVEASDALGNRRTWPAPAIAALDGTGPVGQVVNALYQVDDSTEDGTQPLYKVIMTPAERAILEGIGNNVGGSANSDAQMNATFISIDGTSTDLHYLAGVRNRGHGSRAAEPNNFRVNFRSDQPWKGVLALNLNAQLSWLQVFGAALHTQSGSVGAYSRAVQFRVNNANLAFTGGTERTFGSYAANEAIDADWADRHFPNDSNGNVYRAIRDLQPPNFDYRRDDIYPGLAGPENKDSYTNTWFKSTNNSEDDWTDLIALLRVLGPNGTDPFTIENIERVIDVRQWLFNLAIMNLLGSSETGLNTGHNDDYYMYRGVNDPRFKLMYYDLDQILGFGGSYAPTAQLFSAALPNGAGEAIGRILQHPDFQPLYYEALRTLVETTFSAASFNALVDQILGDFVPESTRSQIKNYMELRRNFVLSQLPPEPPTSSLRAVISAPPRSPTLRTSATFQVSGENITHYRYSLNGGPLSPETAVQTPISLSSLANGTNTLRVIGRNAAGAYQSTLAATTASWIVNSAWPAVRLNELIAARSANQLDQIELYNEGAIAINLAGLRLSDDPANPNRYTFGATVLNPGAYLVLNSTQLGFSFGSEGEGLYFWNSVAAGGALLDSVEFGPQITDYSIGRLGESGAWLLTQPTFGAVNVVQPLGNATAVKINEWHTAGLSPYPDDFIELYNPEALPASIGGAYLTDQRAGAPTQNRIAALTFIPARGHVVFTSGNGNSADEINFALPSEQGEITLFDAELSVIDSIVYGPQRTGISSGRCPDGAPAQKALQSPSPGAPNDCPIEPLPPQRIVLLPFSQDWKYNASGADLGTAWKERVYEDALWSSGPGVLGFETDLLAEPLRTRFSNSGAITYYFRTSFQADPSIVPSSIEISHIIDDGAAFYLNGQEIGQRYGLPPNATAQTFAAGNIGNASVQSFTIPPDRLSPGLNVLAVEVHQVNSGSSDMVMGLQVSALIVTNAPGAAGILINELLADNATLTEVDGSSSDWVELYNPSQAAVDLVGMSLTDAAANPTRWIFPAGSLVPADGYLRILCSSDLPASATNTGFGLSAEGGALFLYNSPAQGGALQSSITYGLQAADWSIGRVPDGSVNWRLNIPTPAMANRAATLGDPSSLRANEWLADPASGQDWFEIFNASPEPVELSGLWLSDDLNDRDKHILPPLSFIGNASRAFRRFEADEVLTSASHVSFRLGAGGESIAISFPTGALIDGVSFGQQSRGVSQGRLLDGGANIVSFPASPSPGSANYLPLQSIVVNEVLSHSDLPLMDAVELYNPTANPVSIGGWFLSDSRINLRKYQIPQGVIVPAGGYAVLYEDDFNGDTASEPFSFSSASGDEVFLSEAVNGVLTGYRAAAQFGAAENGVSFGRYQTSHGFDFVPMVSRTFGKDNPTTTTEFKTGSGLANSMPRIGPIVISEIMYHPPGTNDALEFLELHNISAAPVTLQHPAHPANTWRLWEGIEFQFAPGTTIPAGGSLLVVNFDPVTDTVARAAFQAVYGTTATLVGPYLGRLRDSGDVIELQKPDAPDVLDGSVPYVLVDRVSYLDVAPWPARADGLGDSLQKISRAVFGNDPINWIAAAPTPGPVTSNDSDNDGMPNDWELLYGLNTNDGSDALLDRDGDGLSNRDEYLAGTSPINSADTLELAAARAGADLALTFRSAPGRSYILFYSDVSPVGPWQQLESIPASGSAGLVVITDPSVRGARRFYYLRAQIAP